MATPKKLPPLPKTFLAKYGDGGKATHGQRMRSKAIRAEWPGGNELLDCIQKAHELRAALANQPLSGTVFANLDAQEKLLNAMYDAAAAAIIARYEAADRTGDELSY